MAKRIASVLALVAWGWGLYTNFTSGGNIGDGLIGSGFMAVLAFFVTLLILTGLHYLVSTALGWKYEHD